MKQKLIKLIMGISIIGFLLPIKANAVLPGDINGDGVVSISEVQTVINAFLGLIKDSTASNSLVGSWYAAYPTAGQAKGPVVITFIDNSTFIMAHDGDIVADPSGQPGIERGTYTWDQTTGAFNAIVVVDTNGEWGFSHPSPTNLSVSVDGNSLLMEGVIVATRVR